MVALTGCAKTFNEAKPKPAPYSVRARVKAARSSGVGTTWPVLDRLAKRLSMGGGALALVCRRRRWAAVVNAAATVGGLVDSSPRTMALKLWTAVS